MNTYEKMTAGSFKSKLKEGRYDTATGARRAIGKSSMSEADKATANKAVNTHFNVTAMAAPKRTATKPAVKKAAAKVKAARGATPRAKGTKRAAKKTGGKSSRASGAEGRPGQEQEAAEDTGLTRTHQTIQMTKNAMDAAAAAKTVDPGYDATGLARTGMNILERALSQLNQATRSVNELPPGAAPESTEPKA